MSVNIPVGLVLALLVFLAVYASRGKLKPQFPLWDHRGCVPIAGGSRHAPTQLAWNVGKALTA